MKKIKKHLNARYGPVKLNANDVSAIFDAMEGCDERILTVDDFEYDSVEEWLEKSDGRIPKSISLVCRNPTITVQLAGPLSYLTIYSDDIRANGYFNKINAIIAHCQRRPVFLYGNLFMGSSLVLIFPVSQFLPHLGVSAAVVLSVLLLWLLLFLWQGYVTFVRHSLVLPYTVKPGTFWRRNSDDIWKMLIAAALGALVTLVIDRLKPTAPIAATPSATSFAALPSDVPPAGTPPK